MIYLIIVLIIWALLERKARFGLLKKHHARCYKIAETNRALWRKNLELSSKIEEFCGLEALIKLAKSEVSNDRN
tara:strand:+ start:171 stop:392 length:222 start_codon:yes stop_codon:yes gene_type:complete